MKQKTWHVDVYVDGKRIVTLSDSHVSGKDLTPEDEQAIRDAAYNLLAFVGEEVTP